MGRLRFELWRAWRFGITVPSGLVVYLPQVPQVPVPGTSAHPRPCPGSQTVPSWGPRHEHPRQKALCPSVTQVRGQGRGQGSSTAVQVHPPLGRSLLLAAALLLLLYVVRLRPASCFLLPAAPRPLALARVLQGKCTPCPSILVDLSTPGPSPLVSLPPGALFRHLQGPRWGISQSWPWPP